MVYLGFGNIFVWSSSSELCIRKIKRKWHRMKHRHHSLLPKICPHNCQSTKPYLILCELVEGCRYEDGCGRKSLAICWSSMVNFPWRSKSVMKMSLTRNFERILPSVPCDGWVSLLKIFQSNHTLPPEHDCKLRNHQLL